MNAAQAKQLPLRSILERLGHTPHHETRGELWYTSPFRQESQPSFKVNEAENVWYDFGAGEGGNVLDFIMQLNQHRDISAALKTLQSLMGSARPDTRTGDLFAPERSRERPTPDTKPPFTLRKVQPLQNRALIQYLHSRGIAVETAAPFVQEVYYNRDGKAYFALGFTNDSGGYELRNPYFKGVLGNKDITLLGTGENATNGSEVLLVFEGFMDFLSYLTHFGLSQPNTAVLVLNSVAMKGKAVETITSLNPAQVQLYLDHDKAGRSLTEYFQMQLPHNTVTDQSHLFAGYEDFNDYLMAKNQKPLASAGR